MLHLQYQVSEAWQREDSSFMPTGSCGVLPGEEIAISTEQRRS